LVSGLLVWATLYIHMHTDMIGIQTELGREPRSRIGDPTRAKVSPYTNEDHPPSLSSCPCCVCDTPADCWRWQTIVCATHDSNEGSGKAHNKCTVKVYYHNVTKLFLLWYLTTGTDSLGTEDHQR